jgi:hypothetical protein
MAFGEAFDHVGYAVPQKPPFVLGGLFDPESNWRRSLLSIIIVKNDPGATTYL